MKRTFTVIFVIHVQFCLNTRVRPRQCFSETTSYIQQNHDRIFTTMQDHDQDELPVVLVKFRYGGSRLPPASVRFPHLTFVLRKF